MKLRSIVMVAAGLLLIGNLVACVSVSTPLNLAAERLPDLPDRHGFAGAYAGVSNGALVVAGGTNFPDAPPWAGGTKTWYDSAYVLPAPDAEWRDGFLLPMKLAYGVSITTGQGLMCIGGCDSERNHDDVFLLHWDGQGLVRRDMPSLPEPASASGGVSVGSRIYVAGGQAGPDPLAGPSGSGFWVLDIADAEPQWRSLPSWPGPERFYPIMGTDGEAVYLISGIRRIIEQGKSDLEYLSDAYRFDPSTGHWERLAEMPRPNAAVASPAPLVDGKLILLGSGADGIDVDQPLEARKFGREILAYDIASDRWESVGELPFARVAVPAVTWHGKTVIPSGESRPGVRSNEVWSLAFTTQ